MFQERGDEFGDGALVPVGVGALVGARVGEFGDGSTKYSNLFGEPDPGFLTLSGVAPLTNKSVTSAGGIDALRYNAAAPQT